MNYKYKDPEVVTLTENIIKVLEEIDKRDDALFEDAHIAIDMEDYSAKYVDGDDVIIDDLEDSVEYCDLDLYHPESMEWVRYDSKHGKYQIMTNEINSFAQEYVQNYRDIFDDMKRDMENRPGSVVEFT
jgi:hypothetical protein